MQTALGTPPWDLTPPIPMSYDLEHILSLDEWTDADREAVRTAIQADPDLRWALRRWFALSSAVAGRCDQRYPSRNALVLVACRDRWAEADLSQEETALLEEAAARIDEAAIEHPALELILSRIRDEATAFDGAWNEAFSAAPRASDRGPLRSERNAGPLRLVRMALAAAAVIAMIVVGQNVLTTDSEAPFATHLAQGTAQTVTLVDGTEVRLAAGSRLDVLFDGESEERRVVFEGSAFFDVAEGPRVFQVETPNALTTVLGTSFGLRTQSGTDVTLVSGRVSLAAIDTPDDATILAPGDQGLLPLGTTDVEVRAFSQLEGFDWTGLLVFRNTPMAQVAERLTKEFGITITVGEELSEAPLTGTFESERGTKAILQIIVSALGANLAENEDGSFHISVQQ